MLHTRFFSQESEACSQYEIMKSALSTASSHQEEADPRVPIVPRRGSLNLSRPTRDCRLSAQATSFCESETPPQQLHRTVMKLEELNCRRMMAPGAAQTSPVDRASSTIRREGASGFGSCRHERGGSTDGLGYVEKAHRRWRAGRYYPIDRKSRPSAALRGPAWPVLEVEHGRRAARPGSAAFFGHPERKLATTGRHRHPMARRHSLSIESLLNARRAQVCSSRHHRVSRGRRGAVPSVHTPRSSA